MSILNEFLLSLAVGGVLFFGIPLCVRAVNKVKSLVYKRGTKGK